MRTAGGTAKLQISGKQLGQVLEDREKIAAELKKYYQSVVLDLEVIR